MGCSKQRATPGKVRGWFNFFITKNKLCIIMRMSLTLNVIQFVGLFSESLLEQSFPFSIRLCTPLCHPFLHGSTTFEERAFVGT